jgi:hypothetical protein
VLLARPEVVAGVSRAVAAAGGDPPDLFHLAAWLGGAVSGPAWAAHGVWMG